MLAYLRETKQPKIILGSSGSVAAIKLRQMVVGLAVRLEAVIVVV